MFLLITGAIAAAFVAIVAGAFVLGERSDRNQTIVPAAPPTDPVETPADSGVLEILPPDESWGGLTRGDWDAQYWQRVIIMPTGINPYFDVNGELCGYQQSGPVFILPGHFGGPMIAERTCTVAEGTAIFVHVAGEFCTTVNSPPNFGRTEEELATCASALMDEVPVYEASVNGQDVADLEAYRTISRMFTAIAAPEGAPFGYQPGMAGNVVSDSISFLIAPPPPGEYEITASQGKQGITATLTVVAPEVIEPPGSEAPPASEAPNVTEPPSTT